MDLCGFKQAVYYANTTRQAGLTCDTVDFCHGDSRLMWATRLMWYLPVQLVSVQYVCVCPGGLIAMGNGPYLESTAL